MIFFLLESTNYLLIDIILNLDLVANLLVKFVSLLSFGRSLIRNVLKGSRLAERNVNVGHVKFFTLSFILGLHKLRSDVWPITHTALHNALHQMESFLGSPLLI